MLRPFELPERMACERNTRVELHWEAGGGRELARWLMVEWAGMRSGVAVVGGWTLEVMGAEKGLCLWLKAMTVVVAEAGRRMGRAARVAGVVFVVAAVVGLGAGTGLATASAGGRRQ